ncbi:GNAT family N-acetyltransferase [Amycolatopsis antarctica]|uniref:GNAT family N-acetyltransferase n=1 Tax=Amycolatopsis antarctica TaxID=1854586 RepID=A0A263D720_9PSEU|nr:GNAT family N-acetyltransferase [Amycolatopsis antarctica]OZM73367.1 GNAT family N-acetyltransferase [Amycolatopsis antarctica]
MRSDIQSALRASVSRDAQRAGPFLIHFDADDGHPFRNYAIPDDGARPSAADVADLVAAFIARGRMPRLEYVRPAPAVDAALAEAGFTVDLRLPLMTLPPGGLRVPDPPAGVTVTVAAADADLRAAALVQNIAYGGPPEVTAADVTRLRSTGTGGGTVVLARCHGVAAGAGLCTPPSGGLSQLAAVAVLPAFRRRGIASAVGADLSRRVLNAGATPYLETESVNENRLYGRIGYVTIGEMIAISLQP